MKNTTFYTLVLFFSVFLAVSDQSAYTLEYATYLGGESWDEAYSLTITPGGNVVATGITHGPTFPTTGGAYDETYNGDLDMFVMVLTPDLSSLVASTLIGGSGQDEPFHSAVDRIGNIIISGWTFSDDFPTTPGAFDTSYNDTYRSDIVVLILEPNLESLVASTYVGGEDSETADSMVIDDHYVVIGGSTLSQDFPISPNAFDTQLEAPSAIVFKMSQDLSEILASTFIGSSDWGASWVTDLVIDEDGNYAYSGVTYAEDYPTTPGAYDRTLSGTKNIVVTKLSSDLSELLLSTYIGGSERDSSAALALDREGNAVVFGDTTSPDFPSTSGAYDPTFNPNGTYAYPDLILLRLSADFSTLIASTFIGSSNSSDRASAMTIDNSGNIIATGSSFNTGFPVTQDAFDASFNGYDDVVLFVMSHDLDTLHYSTFVGGLEIDVPRDIVQSGPNGVYVVGHTGGDFPITQGAYDSDNNFIDGFLMKFEFPDNVSPGLVTGPGPGEGNPPLVRTSGAEWQAYGVAKYGVNVACGDLDGNGYDEIITGAGPGAVFGPHVRGWNSNGTALPNVNLLAYGTNRWGVNVSSGDLDGDGMDEILTGAGPGDVFGPHVRGWNVDGGTAASIGGISYFAYGTNKYGVNVSAGDIDGDGFDEIVTGAGPGTVFGPHVRGWDYDGTGPIAAISAVSYLAYGTNQWGVNVACGDLDGDGFEEIITGPGPGIIFGSHVRGWNYDGNEITPMGKVSYFAYPETAFGVVVSAFDVDGDGIEEILTMPGPDPAQPAHARAWNVDGGDVTAIEEIDFYPYSDEMLFGGRIAGGRFESARR